MRKFLSFFLLSLVFLASSPMVFAAADKKDGKDDGKNKPDKGQEPIFLPFLIWNGPWSPIMREAPLENSISTFVLSEESSEIF